MEKYNYLEAVKEDVKDYINNHNIIINEDNREEVEQELNDKLFCEDSVTGNASGSYTFNTWTAEQNLLYNKDLLIDAIEAFGDSPNDYKRCLESSETADVTIRCYLLPQAISEVLDEMEE